MRTSDFLIIGGGVIGMMTAWQLAEAGHTVTILERGRCGRQASWAGGGIISPLYPWQQADAISRLAGWVQCRYPALAQQLAAETGIDPEYRGTGLLYIDPQDADRACAWAARMGQALITVDAAFAYEKEPHLAPDINNGLWMPELGSIRNPRLCQALRAKLRQLPRVYLGEGIEVRRLRYAHSQSVIAQTSHGARSAGRTIVCCGAWTGTLLASLGLNLPVHPVKGQMLLFNTPPGDDRMLVERVVLRDGRYLIPRADGRVLAGSTLEEAAFDQTATREARESLRKSAAAIVPALAQCKIEHHWAGLRPAAPDGIPFIGAVPGIDGLYVNAGHYRNGLVLAPAATRLLVDELLERPPIVDADPYRPGQRGVVTDATATVT
jgi:glycine oxidase